MCHYIQSPTQFNVKNNNLIFFSGPSSLGIWNDLNDVDLAVDKPDALSSTSRKRRKTPLLDLNLDDDDYINDEPVAPHKRSKLDIMFEEDLEMALALSASTVCGKPLKYNSNKNHSTSEGICPHKCVKLSHPGSCPPCLASISQ